MFVIGGIKEKLTTKIDTMVKAFAFHLKLLFFATSNMELSTDQNSCLQLMETFLSLKSGMVAGMAQEL